MSSAAGDDGSPPSDGPRATEVLASILALLEREGVDYRRVDHGPTKTSEESAAARGEPLAIGGKALLVKVDKAFGLFVFSAARRLDSGALKRHSSAKKSRFASAEELLESTGLVPGSVPPFGRPILPFTLYLDAVFDEPRIAFNAGSLTTSLVLPFEGYLRVARPERFAFSKA